MTILKEGARLYPLVNYGAIRIFSINSPEAIVSGDNGAPSFQLKEQIMALSESPNADAVSLSYLNRLIGSSGMPTVVVSRDQIHQEGDPVDDFSIQALSEKIASSVLDQVGFPYLIDTMDRKTVLVVLGYPPVFGGKL